MRVIYFGLVLSFLTLKSFAQNNVQTAISFVTHLSKNEFEKAAQLFDANIAPVNAGVLQNGWQQIQGAFGKYKSYYLPVITDSNMSSIVVGIQFEKETQGFSCNFNDSKKLAGFLLVPAPTNPLNAVPQNNSLYPQKEVSIPVNGGILKGTIMQPVGEKAHSYVVIIAGSGPTDRDGNNPLGVKAYSYKLLAEALASAGIASLRYDKRLIAASTTGFALDESILRFEDYANDAAACLKYIKDKEKAKALFIAGHSEGSLAGILAAQKTPVQGFISLCGAGENIADILKRQLNQAPAERILDTLKSGRQVQAIPADLQAIFRPSVQPYLISWMKYNPATEIARLKIPVLIIGGTTDIQVPPADAVLLHNALPKSQLLIVEGMSHILKNAPADKTLNAATYSQPDLPLNKLMVQKVIEFIKGQ